MKRRMIQVAAMSSREIRRFMRQRSRVVGSVLQPVVFWLFLGAGLNSSFTPHGAPSGTSYMEYFYPGVMALVLLFTAIFATITTIEDRQAGFLQGVIVSPVKPATVVVGQALGCAALALLEGTIFLALAWPAGISLTVRAVVASESVMAAIALALAGLGLAISWRLESTQGFHAIMNLILIPIWFLSGAFFPESGAPRWLGWIMAGNPLTYAMELLRRSLYWGRPHPPVFVHQLGISVVITLAMPVLTLMLAVHAARRSFA